MAAHPFERKPRNATKTSYAEARSGNNGNDCAGFPNLDSSWVSSPLHEPQPVPARVQSLSAVTESAPAAMASHSVCSVTLLQLHTTRSPGGAATRCKHKSSSGSSGDGIAAVEQLDQRGGRSGVSDQHRAHQLAVAHDQLAVAIAAFFHDLYDLIPLQLGFERAHRGHVYPSDLEPGIQLRTAGSDLSIGR